MSDDRKTGAPTPMGAPPSCRGKIIPLYFMMRDSEPGKAQVAASRRSALI